MTALLSAMASELCVFLERVLPSLSPDWWSENVIGVLTSQQQRAVEQKGGNALSALDFSALLRVFDENWYDIGSKVAFSSDARRRGPPAR